MMGASSASSSSGVRAVPVARVPTGMTTGVWTVPRAVRRVPRRAREPGSRAPTENAKGTRHRTSAPAAMHAPARARLLRWPALEDAIFQDRVHDAAAHARQDVAHAIQHTPDRNAVIVADSQCGLSRILAAAYRAALPGALHLDFAAVPPDEILGAFAKLQAGDLVVLLQTRSFRLEAFRVRIDLFKRGLKVIGHPHLFRMAQSEYDIYLDSLAYDPANYRRLGHVLLVRFDRADGAVVDSGGELLVDDSPFEVAKLNIGDFATLKNVGGQFPIGEVFTEPRDLERVNGRVRIFKFGDNDFRATAPERPITLVVERGRITGVVDSPPHFDEVLAKIGADEEL